MIYNVIYKNMSENQKLNLKKFIKENFINIYNFGIQDNTIIILKYENKKILGCICLLSNKILQDIIIKNNSNINNYKFDETKSLFLYNFCVDINYRNQKYGLGLIEHTLNLCKEIDIDHIYCHAENEISKNIFLKCGFMQDKDINNTTYLMCKYI
jgi:ribosomal protein S18 acetylase RimI-like enzyme